MNSSRLVSIPILAAVLAASPARAKTVVCVDGAPDLSAYEGFVSTQLTVPPDVVQVGGTIKSCMEKLVKGDQLIVIAHGYTENGPPRQIGFIWQGARYSGFGAGAGKYPVPAGFAGLNNITVTMGSCWSARDPDGAGGQPPVTESLQSAMLQGAGNSVSGFTGAATNNTIVEAGNPDRNTTHQIDAAKQWLGENQHRWRNRAPAGNKRNPPPASNEQSEAKRLVDSVFAGKDIPVTIRYTTVRDTRGDPFQNQSPELRDGVNLEAGPGFQWPATHETDNCPYAYLYFVTEETLPVGSPPGMWVLLAILTTTALVALRRAPTRSAG